MSKTSKKRGFPKLSKWGKFLKLRSSKKKENKTISEQEKHEVDNTRRDQEKETTSLLIERIPEDNDPKSKNEIEKPLEQMNGDFKGLKSATSVDLSQKLQDSEERNGVSRPVLDGEISKTEIGKAVIVDNKDKNLVSDISVHPNPSPSKEISEGLISDQELVSTVIIHTPSPKKSSETSPSFKKTANDENEEELAFPILLNTPSPKIGKANRNDQEFSVRKDKKDEDDFVISAIDLTPSQRKTERRDRVLTVKKIRSIIATPYKRLKREGSLLDGQTYRYIEVQSLVNAFQSMHSCIGTMIACNEKGLQYGKSSVLRIECKECNKKVFLQASKN